MQAVNVSKNDVVRVIIGDGIHREINFSITFWLKKSQHRSKIVFQSFRLLQHWQVFGFYFKNLWTDWIETDLGDFGCTK